ncbi:MAG: class I tRNA ligase family protein, partial [Cyanobacteria bacterium NC_groundwater_1444_Ag_S-0.65um_54_12]|nr:class I tRNA ligase family protein [Cyanobacteria bacterium NC_groundwater_1444_Ag_S-0.65um_54_12]
MEVAAPRVDELAKAYDPAIVENIWLKRWQELGAFRTQLAHEKRPYLIPCPPPNVTGALHIGHAVNGTLQDVLARAKRMMGYAVLWQPGTDHAGIPTQLLVERKLFLEHGKSRQEIGRDEFLRQVWAWKEEYGNTIIDQFRRLGASLDYDRWRFTMDANYTHSIRTAFVHLFEKGYITRGQRMVNWCPRCLTSMSDLEVKYETTSSFLYHVRYLDAAGTPGVVIATVRPETILADVAVAVHPADARYRSLIGSHLRVPLTERLVPVIADDHVDPDFGTGALKITPGHDPDDFVIAERHQLPTIDVLTPAGKMSEVAGT